MDKFNKKKIKNILGAFIVMGSIFNVNIAALATGLGIGGIALAYGFKRRKFRKTFLFIYNIF